MDIDHLRPALAGHVVGSRLLHYDVLGSAMDEAHRLAGRGTREGTVVLVEAQTAGRGRFNRPWISPPGQNLSFAVILRPLSSELPYVNMAATMAVSRAVRDATGLASAVKWPNDVRIDGRKVSGILIETEMDGERVRHAVVGVGLNVNFDPSQFVEIADIATSMSVEVGHTVDRTGVLQLVLEHMDGLYRDVKRGRSLTHDWAATLETLGRHVKVSWEGRTVEGTAEAVDDHGNLVLTRPDGTTLTVVAGEVTLQV